MKTFFATSLIVMAANAVLLKQNSQFNSTGTAAADHTKDWNSTGTPATGTATTGHWNADGTAAAGHWNADGTAAAGHWDTTTADYDNHDKKDYDYATGTYIAGTGIVDKKDQTPPAGMKYDGSINDWVADTTGTADAGHWNDASTAAAGTAYDPTTDTYYYYQ